MIYYFSETVGPFSTVVCVHSFIYGIIIFAARLDNEFYILVRRVTLPKYPGSILDRSFYDRSYGRLYDLDHLARFSSRRPSGDGYIYNSCDMRHVRSRRGADHVPLAA